jgi:hypothetical protein
MLNMQGRPSKRKAASSEGESESDYETGRRTAARNNTKNKPSYVVPDTDEVCECFIGYRTGTVTKPDPGDPGSFKK